ncbi:MAG TPA: hybrid sensor histidine kinase/response regulator [Anaerohalosphaeraceae bacterium]|nr:hybrid sensor histidine kinase/response regulator [Phycisphaerae bacterium]HOK95378.1 hybrid sensor histidine kinase/response regulator [Anaerohalosphaeraceae bacterium]HOM75599.1 hybrid sensor histidine kinase/response regulator [Anaerohalosphaeraceae bacterium]HPC63527.1 hybrid sensor histidine kinase/response regulator [Anaerohalosphaeraceae bacterium]HPO69536.1 hybrid sensor histidine kinase/response regulator [Anaerohalosphaeraceae bacterium]
MPQEQHLNRRILLVDDEIRILDELKKVLAPSETTSQELQDLESRLFGTSSKKSNRLKTYHVECCCQGDQAIEVVRNAIEIGKPFAVAFLDIRMPPGPDGVWTAEQIRRLDPNVQIVMMTGYSDFDINEIARRVPPEDKLLYMQKPIHSQEILQFALALTAKWQSDYLLHLQNQKLQEQNEALKEHDRLKSEFVMTVSHELRTPLTIFKNILSNAMAGVMGKIPPKLQRNLEMADEAIARLTSIINDFLDISKLDVGRMKLYPEKLCVQNVIRDIVEMIRFVTDAKNIQLELTLHSSDLYIYADYEKFARVINNLIENAVKFVPEQTGKITIRVEDRGTRIGIAIEDNGPGVPDKDKEKIFDRFVQVEKHVGPGKHGTGLGLAICRELVQLHSGRIWVEDNPGGGAVFRILLPKYDPLLAKESSAAVQPAAV